MTVTRDRDSTFSKALICRTYDFEGVFASYPTANVSFDPDLSSPLTTEFSASFAADIHRRGTIQASYIWRHMSGLVEDFVDLSRGTTHVVDDGVEAGTPADRSWWPHPPGAARRWWPSTRSSVRSTRAEGFYTTPLKALSNQKFGDLVAAYGPGSVGLLTGDTTLNGEAPVVVMTTEVLRNMLYERSDALEGLTSVVLDEVHYLQDPYRGAVWEEVLIHLPGSVNVVCLSATISNAEEFGEWVQTLRGQTRVVIEEQRPVPLEHHYLIGRTLHPMHVEQDGVPLPNPYVVSLDQRDHRAKTATRRRGGPHPRQPLPDLGTDIGVCTRPDARTSSTSWPIRACCRRSTSCSAAPAVTGASGGSWTAGSDSPRARKRP